MKPVRTWILVADGTRARVLLNEGPGKGIRQLRGADISLPDLTPGVDQSDRPGRVHESVGSTRHAVEPRKTPHDASQRLFAEQLADTIAGHSEHYDRLVMIAAPETLGALRDSLPKDVSTKIHGTLAKDLTNTPTEKIPDHITEIMIV